MAIGFPRFMAAQAPAAGERPAKEEMVTLQYPNNPVTDLLAVYERLTGKKLIKDANLTGSNLSVVAPQPIPASEAIRFIEAAMILNGYTLVPADDNSVKVLNAAKLPRSEALPLYANVSALPKGEQVVSFFMPLHYINPTDAINVFNQHIKVHAYGAIVPVPSAQALLITENASVIRHLASVQDLIDVPPAKVVSKFVTLDRADAERVAEIILKLLGERKTQQASAAPGIPAVTFPGQPNANAPVPPELPINPASGVLYERNLVVGDVQLIPDPRTNRILVVTRPVNFDYIQDLIREFDSATTLTQPEEIFLQYVSAAEILPVLENVLSEGKEEAGGPSATAHTTPAPSPAPAQTSSSPSSLGHLTVSPEDTAPEALTVGKTRIMADKKANSIMVMGPPESIDKVKAIVGRFDKRPLQVYLSTVIGQLTLGNNLEFGVDLLQKFARLNGTPNSATQPGIATGIRNRFGAADLVPDPRTLLSNAAFPLPAGLTLYGTFGATLDAFVKALESTNRFRVLSRPVVYTANNKKAVISSGQKIAVPTSTLSSLTAGSTNNNTAVSASIEFKDVVLKLEVLPLINANKEVTLQIAEQNDTIVGSQTISGNTVPTIGTQEINTTITVPNLSTVALGGLITDTKSTNTTGVPWLSRIPILGYLFKDTQKNDNRSELLILMQPFVVKSDEDMIAAQIEEKDRAKISKEAADMAEPPAPKKPEKDKEPDKDKEKDKPKGD